MKASNPNAPQQHDPSDLAPLIRTPRQRLIGGTTSNPDNVGNAA
jgi:hypothetical protein